MVGRDFFYVLPSLLIFESFFFRRNYLAWNQFYGIDHWNLFPLESSIIFNFRSIVFIAVQRNWWIFDKRLWIGNSTNSVLQFSHLVMNMIYNLISNAGIKYIFDFRCIYNEDSSISLLLHIFFPSPSRDPKCFPMQRNMLQWKHTFTICAFCINKMRTNNNNFNDIFYKYTLWPINHMCIVSWSNLLFIIKYSAVYRSKWKMWTESIVIKMIKCSKIF